MMRLAPQLFIGSAFDMNTVFSSGQFATKPGRLFLAKTITMLVFRCHLRSRRAWKPIDGQASGVVSHAEVPEGVSVRCHGKRKSKKEFRV
jgi:hypothetical protein